MSKLSRLTTILVLSLAVLTIAKCGDSDDDVEETATPTQTTTGASSPTATPSGVPTSTPTESPTVERYVDPRFGYSVELPAGWRQATIFMDAFANTGARYQAGGNSEDYAVFTGVSAAEESDAVDTALANHDWIVFFVQDTVEIFPTTHALAAQLTSADEGSVQHLVSNVTEVSLDDDRPATRFTLELYNDEFTFTFDRVFVESTVHGCPTCTGFVIQVAIAGRSFSEPGPVDPPPAAYPVRDFESIFRSFEAAVPLTP